MTQPAISIRNLLVTGGRRTILSVDTLDIPAGQVTTVLGPNGAGKSTLLKTCLGFRKPAAGRVEMLGRRVTSLGGVGLTRLRRRIGYVPQIPGGHSRLPLTLREAVAIGRTGIAGLGARLRREDWRIIDEWMDRLGLSHLANMRYSDLSGGEQRKALIARAMTQEPELLLLDEPTANLDLAWREQIVGTLDELHQRTHMTTVLVCHELEVIPQACSQVVLLVAGRLEQAGPPDSVLTAERGKSLYGPGVRILRAGRRFATVPAGEAAS